MSRPRACWRPAEVLTIGRRGFSLLVDGMPFFLPFPEYPVFQGVDPNELRRVRRPVKDRLYWPALDLELSLREITGASPRRVPVIRRRQGKGAAATPAENR